MSVSFLPMAHANNEIDFLIFIDYSNSMAEDNDPNLLRFSAINSFLDTLRQQTSHEKIRIGAIKFGNKIETIRQLGQSFSHINYDARLMKKSDFYIVFEHALKIFKTQSNHTNRKKVIFIFTDGRPYLSKGFSGNEEKINDYFNDEKFLNIVSEVSDAGIQTFLFAIGDKEIDKKLWTALLDANHYFSIHSLSEFNGIVENTILPSLTAAPEISEVAKEKIKALPDGDSRNDYKKKTGEPLNLNLDGVKPNPSKMSSQKFLLAIIVVLLGIVFLLLLFPYKIYKKGKEFFQPKEKNLESSENELEKLKKEILIALEKLKQYKDEEKKIKECERFLKRFEDVDKKRFLEVGGATEAEKVFQIQFETIIKNEKRRDKFIEKIFKSNSRIRNFLFAKYVADKFYVQPKDFDSAIRKIYEYDRISGKKHIFFRYLSEFFLEKDHDIGKLIGRVCNEIYDVKNSSPEELKKNINEHMVMLIDIFEQVEDSQSKSNLSESAVRYYKYLLRLSEALEIGPVLKIEPIDLSDNCPQVWGKIIDMIRQVDKLVELEKRVLKISDLLANDEIMKENTIDVLLIEPILKKWGKALSLYLESGEPGKPFLEIKPVPDLSLHQSQYQKMKEFIVLIKNKGNGFASNIEIKIQNESKQDFYFIQKGESELGIHSKEVWPVRVEIEKKRVKEKIKVIVCCNDLNGNSHQFNSEPFSIYVSALAQKQADPDKYEVNKPYCGYESLFVGRKKIEEKLLNILENDDKGELLYILGMKLTGKTSLIYHLIKKIDSEKYNTVYFPCILYEREELWTKEYFFGTVARSIRTTLSFNSKNNVSETIDGKMSAIDFQNFIIDLIKEENLILFFDDAEIFGKELKEGYRLFPDWDNIVKIFKEIIMHPSKRKGKLFVISSGSDDVLKIFSHPKAKDQVAKNIFNVTFFEQEDVEQLLRYGLLQLDTITREYLFRLTGGHPSLTQLLCMKLAEKCKNDKTSRGTLRKLKEAVRHVITTPGGSKYFKYIIEYSMPEAMYPTLEKILKKTNNQTMLVDIEDVPKYKKYLDYLAYYNILYFDINIEKYFLRIGILKLWFEESGFTLEHMTEGKIDAKL